MEKVVACGSAINELQFPSPAYTAAVVGDAEDVLVGVGGGKRFGMPNAIVALNTRRHNETKDKKNVNVDETNRKADAAAAPARGAPDGIKDARCWDVLSWLDLGDDIPWSSTRGTVAAAIPHPRGDARRNKKDSSSNKQAEEHETLQCTLVGHVEGVSLIGFRRFQENNMEGGASSGVEPAANAEAAARAVTEAAATGAPRGKRDLPPPPPDAPVRVLRLAKASLVTDANNPEKKVACFVRQPHRQPLSPSSSLHEAGGAVARPLDQILMIASQDDGSLVLLRVRFGSPSSTADASTFGYGSSFFQHVIAAEDVGLQGAHPTDIDAVELASGIVLSMTCEDKKVRYLLLPTVDHCLSLCRTPSPTSQPEEGGASTAALGGKNADGAAKVAASTSSSTERPRTPPPLTVTVRSVLSLTATELGIEFKLMRSSLRQGLLLDLPNKAPSGSRAATTKNSAGGSKKGGAAVGSSPQEAGLSSPGSASLMSSMTVSSIAGGTGLVTTAAVAPCDTALSFIVAYDAAAGESNLVTVAVTIVHGCLLRQVGTLFVQQPLASAVTTASPPALPQQAALKARLCKGAVTTLTPLYEATGAEAHVGAYLRQLRPVPPRWLLTTVDGLVGVAEPLTDGKAGSKNTQKNTPVSTNGNSTAAANTAAAGSGSTTGGLAAIPIPLFSVVESEQRPHPNRSVAKKNALRCGPLHAEPISASAVCPLTGLLITVDIAQKALLTRLHHPIIERLTAEAHRQQQTTKHDEHGSSSKAPSSADLVGALHQRIPRSVAFTFPVAADTALDGLLERIDRKAFRNLQKRLRSTEAGCGRGGGVVGLLWGWSCWVLWWALVVPFLCSLAFHIGHVHSAPLVEQWLASNGLLAPPTP